MLRGIGKRVVVLKNTDSDVFEEAIFIIKSNNKVCQKDILTECEKIINNTCENLNKKKKKTLSIISKISILSLSIGFMLLTIILLINIL